MPAAALIPVIGGIGAGAAGVGGLTLATGALAGAAVGGTVLAAQGLADARKAANTAANQKAPQVDIAATDAQARQIALQNAIDSAELERRFNPGAAELRQGSLEAVLAALNSPTTARDDLAARIAASAGAPLSVGGPQQYDSALTRQAVEAAARDLALGGQLPQDVRNLVARTALARSANITGGKLDLGRDLTTRDLGLTSLDLYNRRLQNAAAIGAQEAALNQGNAALRAQNDAQRLSADQFSRTNLLQSGDFLNSLVNGDFSRALAAAQLGQNIAQPASGLDPGSVANLAVGNVNSQAAQQQNANATRVAAANAMTGFGSSLAGTGVGLAGTFYKPAAPAPYKPFYVQPAGSAGAIAQNIFKGV